MSETVVRVRRELDLAPVIVWDALVDPVLAEGWLHPEARLVGSDSVVRFDEPDVLEIDSPDFGHITFELTELAGGSHGSATMLVIAVRATHEMAEETASLVAQWSTRLDQLEALLRGHPVDWDHWARDHGADYEAYLARALSARAH